MSEKKGKVKASKKSFSKQKQEFSTKENILQSFQIHFVEKLRVLYQPFKEKDS